MNTSVSKYTLRFGLVYAGMLILAGIVTTALGMDSGNSGLQIALVMSAGIVASGKFVKDHMRVPNKSEKRALVFGSFVYSMLVSFLGLALLYFSSNEEEKQALVEIISHVSPIIYTVVFAIMAVTILMVLSFSYGYMAKKTLEGYEKQAQKNKAL